jgi:hypothetical protein
VQVALLNQAVLYERLFLLNQCLEKVCAILDLYESDGVIHPLYASARRRALEDLRADLSHILTGLLHQRELEECIKAVRKEPEQRI